MSKFNSLPQATAIPDRLNVDEWLVPNQVLSSPNRKYKLIMQEDGNLVLYGPESAAWHSNTTDFPGCSLYMQKDGNLCIYERNTGKAVWHANSNRSNFKGCLIVTDAGKVQILDVVKDVTELSARP